MDQVGGCFMEDVWMDQWAGGCLGRYIRRVVGAERIDGKFGFIGWMDSRVV